jgi:hypothetical protein
VQAVLEHLISMTTTYVVSGARRQNQGQQKKKRRKGYTYASGAKQQTKIYINTSKSTTRSS